jgi:hypothetical protein
MTRIDKVFVIGCSVAFIGTVTALWAHQQQPTFHLSPTQIDQILKTPRMSDEEIQQSHLAAVRAQAEYETALKCQPNMGKFSSLHTGMSMSEILNIMGCAGSMLSSSTIAGYRTDMFEWQGSPGNMNVMFQNGRLISKAQSGLR